MLAAGDVPGVPPASDLQFMMGLIGHNWLFALLMLIVLWLLVTRLAETTEAGAKLLGPLGKRVRQAYHRRQQRYRADVAQEAKLLAIELVPKVVPGDYELVKQQLGNIIKRVGDLEVENHAMRAYIVIDEQWHFHHELWIAGGAKADTEGAIPPRMAWSTFLMKWREGWRPEGLASSL